MSDLAALYWRYLQIKSDSEAFMSSPGKRYLKNAVNVIDTAIDLFEADLERRLIAINKRAKEKQEIGVLPKGWKAK